MRNVREVRLPFKVFGDGDRIETISEGFFDTDARPYVAVGKRAMGVQVDDECLMVCGIREHDGPVAGRRDLHTAMAEDQTWEQQCCGQCTGPQKDPHVSAEHRVAPSRA